MAWGSGTTADREGFHCCDHRHDNGDRASLRMLLFSFHSLPSFHDRKREGLCEFIASLKGLGLEFGALLGCRAEGLSGID